MADTPTPAARALLRNLEAACDDLAANRSSETYRNMVDCDRATPYLEALDDARREARAYLTNPPASDAAVPASMAETITTKADQCDRLAEVSRAPACFEYRAKAQAYHEVLFMLAATPKVESHPDDEAVDRFAVRMKAKLAAARAKGRGGWDNPDRCSTDYLRHLLHEHVAKGDPVDVANFCMMLSHYGALTAPKVASDTGAGLAWRLERIRDDNPQLTASDRAFLTEAAAALATDATGLVADLRKAIDGLNASDRDSEKIDGILTALLKRIYHTGSDAGRLIGRLDVERACELAAQVAERERRYEGSDFPVCEGIAREIRLIPAKMWAEG